MKTSHIVVIIFLSSGPIVNEMGCNCTVPFVNFVIVTARAANVDCCILVIDWSLSIPMIIDYVHAYCTLGPVL